MEEYRNTNKIVVDEKEFLEKVKNYIETNKKYGINVQPGSILDALAGLIIFKRQKEEI